MFAVRSSVLPLLENARRDKLIGKSEEAQVTLTATGATQALLTKYATELAELFKVSQVHLAATASEKSAQVMEGVKAEVAQATGSKCPRCWAYRAEVGAQELCHRCTEAVS